MGFAAWARDAGLSSSSSPPSWALAAVTSKATGLTPALSENDIAPPSSCTSWTATAQEGAELRATASTGGGGTGGKLAVPGLGFAIQRSYIQRFSLSRSTWALGCVSSNLAALKLWPATSISTCAKSTRLTDTKETLPWASCTSLTASCGAVSCSTC